MKFWQWVSRATGRCRPGWWCQTELIRSSRKAGVSSVPASMSVDRQGPNVCIVSPGAAVVLVAVVDEESGQPGLEPIRIAEAGQLTPGDHQRVLDRVLGSFVVSQDPSRDPEQPVTAGASQDGERLPVTALGCDDKLRIHDPPYRPLGRERRPPMQTLGDGHPFKLSGAPSSGSSAECVSPRQMGRRLSPIRSSRQPPDRRSAGRGGGPRIPVCRSR